MSNKLKHFKKITLVTEKPSDNTLVHMKNALDLAKASSPVFKQEWDNSIKELLNRSSHRF